MQKFKIGDEVVFCDKDGMWQEGVITDDHSQLKSLNEGYEGWTGYWARSSSDRYIKRVYKATLNTSDQDETNLEVISRLEQKNARLEEEVERLTRDNDRWIRRIETLEAGLSFIRRIVG